MISRRKLAGAAAGLLPFAVAAPSAHAFGTPTAAGEDETEFRVRSAEPIPPTHTIEVPDDLLGPSTAPKLSIPTHTVQPGDTLSNICAEYAVSIWDVVRWNNIANPDLIYEGQVLQLAGAPSTHTVQPNDTLTKIAAFYKVQVSDLVRWNGIADANFIQVGQVLKLAEEPMTVTVDRPAPKAMAGTVFNAHGWDSMLQELGAKYGVPWAFLKAVMLAESGGDPNAVGDNGHSIGLFQLHDQGYGFGMGDARYDPYTNADTAARGLATAWQIGTSKGYSGEYLIRFAYDHTFNPGGGWAYQGDRVVAQYNWINGG